MTNYNSAIRYRLRTLLIVLALGPPVLAVIIYVWAMRLGAGAPTSNSDNHALYELMMNNLGNNKPPPIFKRLPTGD